MPWSLRRFHQSGNLHFLTFSCYHRLPKLSTPASRDRFELPLESTREKYNFHVFGYVVMPEHVHLLLTEPESALLSVVVQSLKQSVTQHLGNSDPFWQRRYYDFNVFSEAKHIEKLRYMHRNPVVLGLVATPDQWRWSRFNQYASGSPGRVQVTLLWLTAPSQIQNNPTLAAPE
jgi:putative transposase